MSKQQKLSREEWLRRIDALIAEHCFGWKWIQETKTNKRFVGPDHNPGIIVERHKWNTLIGGSKDPYLPRYTVDKAAAFDVVLWLLDHFGSPEGGPLLKMCYFKEIPVIAVANAYRVGIGGGVFTGPTLQLTICQYTLLCLSVPCPKA